MEQKKIRLMISVLLITLSLAACSSPAASVSPSPSQAPDSVLATATGPAAQPSATLEQPTPAAEPSLCVNTYYPVREGATWTYKSTGGPAGEYTFTDTITAVRTNGFTLSTQIGGLTRAQEWTCTADGLAALQFGGAPAAMLNSQNIQMNFDVTNASGVTFPRQINPGDPWQQSADITGNVTLFNEEAQTTGAVQMNFVAVGNENVSVPAGTFEALRVEVDVSLNLSAAYGGITLPVAFTGDYTYWFAPNVGWIKSSGTGSALGTSFTDNTELQSYSIP